MLGISKHRPFGVLRFTPYELISGASMRRTISVLFCLCIVACSKPDEARLIRSAIQFSYPSIYNDLSDLRKDYPGFSPRVRQWSSDLVFLFGEGLYAVQMPEEEVLVTETGIAKTMRSCGSPEADCTLLTPQSPRLGIVGTMQLGAPDFPLAQRLEVSWKGTPGDVNVVGHCFAAFKSSTEPLTLVLKVPGHKPLEMTPGYGARLVAVTFDTNATYYGSGRIPESMFLNSRTCSKQARESWPNVGGWAWKR
jgi:hypothetical protein